MVDYDASEERSFDIGGEGVMGGILLRDGGYGYRL